MTNTEMLIGYYREQYEREGKTKTKTKENKLSLVLSYI